MSNQNYSASITVDRTPKEAFDAIRNVRGWWSEEIEGSTANVGDEFKYHYRDAHFCTMKLVELVPDRRIAWLVTDNYFSFVEDKTEWKGTKVVFDIAKKGEKTEIHFTHDGLVPAYECYNICSDAWGSYTDKRVFIIRRLTATIDWILRTIPRCSMVDLQNEDSVEVVATGRRGRIENTRTDEKQEPIYWVEFDRNFATREWFGPDQLRLIARPNNTEESGFTPSRSILGG